MKPKRLQKIVSVLFMLVLITNVCMLCACTETYEVNENVVPIEPTAYSEEKESEALSSLLGAKEENETFEEIVYGREGYLLGEGKTIFPTAQGEFNKVSISYMSEVPVRLVATYLYSGAEKVDDTLYLEEGKHVFEFLISGYETGKTAIELIKLDFVPCKNDGHFLAWECKTEKVNLCLDDTVYITNGKYKVGAYMEQGGGLNYFSDATLRYLKGKNLLNNYDTGRLVQQSYYGTDDNDEYTSGEFCDKHWVYNPVQGGDQYQNPSRIINYVYNQNSIYIKCQPMDWSLDNFCTPSYMETTYTVYTDRIGVDCRFVDFSGWEHLVLSQELPAFYTISYLDTFEFYKGNKPWQKDELTTLNNLPFWANNPPECVYSFGENTENWCAWTHGKGKYGVGVYSPISTSMVFGRYGDDRSKNPSEKSCSYVAPLTAIQLKSFEAFEYSYLITTGNTEKIRNTFYLYKDFDKQGLSK